MTDAQIITMTFDYVYDLSRNLAILSVLFYLALVAFTVFGNIQPWDIPVKSFFGFTSTMFIVVFLHMMVHGTLVGVLSRTDLTLDSVYSGNITSSFIFQFFMFIINMIFNVVYTSTLIENLRPKSSKIAEPD